MIGQLYINNKDAFGTWGAFLENGSEAKFLNPPANKEYASNDARSQHGKQVFVNNPRMSDRDITIVLGISASSRDDFLTKYRGLVNELNSGLIEVKVMSLKEGYKLTCISYTELSYYDRIGKLSVKFNEPNPNNRIIIE